MNTIPNLDAMDADDLWTFWVMYNRASRTDCERLIGDTRPRYTRIARDLANYACNAAVAKQQRAHGNINVAQMYEHICERIYQTIPADLRW